MPVLRVLGRILTVLRALVRWTFLMMSLGWFIMWAPVQLVASSLTGLTVLAGLLLIGTLWMKARRKWVGTRSNNEPD